MLNEVKDSVRTLSYVFTRKERLQNKQSYFRNKWTQLARAFAPNLLRFMDSTYEDKGGAFRDTHIINPVGRSAREVFKAGMLMLTANPSEVWQRVTLDDSVVSAKQVSPYGESAYQSSVEKYLDDTSNLVLKIYAQSNFYQAYKQCLGDFCTFSSMGGVIEESETKVIRIRPLVTGSYLVERDFDERPTEMMIEHRMSSESITKRFGEVDANGRRYFGHIDNYVKRDAKLKHVEWSVLQYIQENQDYNPNETEGVNSYKFLNCYYFIGRGGTSSGGTQIEGYSNSPENKKQNTKLSGYNLLEVNGVDYNPILFVPWESVQNDVYGHGGPGELALEALRSIQHSERRSDQALDQQIWPTTIGHEDVRITHKNMRSLLPGNIILTDNYEAAKLGLQPVIKAPLNYTQADQRIMRKEETVKNLFYNNLILKISEISKSNVTATEIDALLQEQLVVLVPASGQIRTHYFAPTLEATLSILERRGVLPDPPAGFPEGVPIKPIFESRLLDFQRESKVKALDRVLDLVAKHSGILPNLPKKFKDEKVANKFAEGLGVSAKVVVPDEEFFEITNAQSEDAVAEDSQQEMVSGAMADKLRSETKLADGVSMLDKELEGELG